MVSLKTILISLALTCLSLYTSANAIPQLSTLTSATSPALADRSAPTDTPAPSTSETFVKWLASQGVTRKSRRHLESGFESNPASEQAQVADESLLLSRDISANSDHDAQIWSRNPVSQTIAQLKTVMSALQDDNVLCTLRAKFGSAVPRRSLEVSKRVDEPSACLWNAGQAVVVDIGTCIFQNWRNNPPAIGTYGLCGCTAVAIISQSGAIVAHISPNFNTIDAQLGAMQSLYNQYMNAQTHAYAYYFPPTDTNGNQLVEVFQDYIKHFMSTAMQLGPSVFPYVADPEDTNGHEGTVVVKNIAGAISLYLNNEKIN